MKKIGKKIIIFVIVSFIIWGACNQKTARVLLTAELAGFEINEAEINEQSGDVVNTSLKKLGIVTCVNPDTKEFIALGHSLTNNKTITEIEATCYEAKLKESKNGKLQAYLNEENPIGCAYYDSDYGIYGKINNITETKYQEVETATRYEIKKGEANILIRLNGEDLESFKVEVEAINFLHNNQNLKIKITDTKLIEQTGGIVQGMSGTPVMQNEKLIGIINSVSAIDATEAYAIFIDKIV